jgi:carbon storage regulator
VGFGSIGGSGTLSAQNDTWLLDRARGWVKVEMDERRRVRFDPLSERSFTQRTPSGSTWPSGFQEGSPMLVLSRKKNESIIINDNITVTVVEIRGDKVRLGIDAPKEVSVHRREVYEAIQDQARRANQVPIPPDTGVS